MHLKHRTSILSMAFVVTFVPLVGACGHETSSAGRHTANPPESGPASQSDGAAPVSSLSDWKTRGDAIVAATVTHLSRVPIDEPPPHKLYATQIDIAIDRTLWTYPPRRTDATLSAPKLRLYGQQLREADSGDLIPIRRDGRGADTPALEVGDHFVASIVLAPENAQTDWDLFLTAPNTMISVVDGALQPGRDAPGYLTDFRGDSIDQFAAAVEDVPASNHIDPWSPDVTNSTTDH